MLSKEIQEQYDIEILNNAESAEIRERILKEYGADDLSLMGYTDEDTESIEREAQEQVDSDVINAVQLMKEEVFNNG